MLQLLSTIDHEFPTSKQDLSKEIQEYHQYRDDLYSIDGVILYKDCIVIPPSIQEDILDILHSAHQSISPMLSRTMETVFWPGFTKAIHVCQNCCTDCYRNTPSQPHHHHSQFRPQATLFNVFVAISSIIKVPKFLLPLITIRTGPQLRWHMKTLWA